MKANFNLKIQEVETKVFQLFDYYQTFWKVSVYAGKIIKAVLRTENVMDKKFSTIYYKKANKMVQKKVNFDNLS